MKIWLPLLAILGLGIAVTTVVIGSRHESDAPTVAGAPRAPFNEYVAGAGILEANTQNIAVGTPVSGIISNVYGKCGDRVKVGDLLFEMDDRDLQAGLVSAEAKFKQAEAVLEKSRYHLEIAEKMGSLISKEELADKRYDAAISEAALKVAKAQMEEVRMELGRRAIRSPIAGRILGINVRAGEFASSDATGPPLMLLGNDDSLLIRVEVDEYDAGRVRAGAKAMAFLRGNPEVKFPIEFQRIEPRIIPKTLLTGRGTERTDVRVLQVIYGFARASWPVYVGQEMDVFIEAPPWNPESK